MGNKKYIIGIDEVGRGALAGPVTVAAVAIPKHFKPQKLKKELGVLRDSKKLSPVQRERWFRYFSSQTSFLYAVSRVYPRSIEKINISNAANRAATRAFEKLSKETRQPIRVFLDGGLFLERQEIIKAKTLVKADEKITAVKIASIIAKVSRDRYMRNLSRKHPVYRFEIHKGYGTKTHRNALREHGPSPVHRLTFLRKNPIFIAR